MMPWDGARWYLLDLAIRITVKRMAEQRQRRNGAGIHSIHRALAALQPALLIGRICRAWFEPRYVTPNNRWRSIMMRRRMPAVDADQRRGGVALSVVSEVTVCR